MGEWRKAAVAFDGSDLELGSLNCDVHRQFCARMHLGRFPSIRLIVPGDDDLQGGQVWGTYRGPLTAARLVDWVEEEFGLAQEAFVGSLTDATFAREVLASEPLWLVQFTAPHAAWCATCVELAPLARRMSAFLRPAGVRFGVVDCEREPDLCRRYGVGKPFGDHEGDFPQLLGFARGKYKAAPDRLLPSAIGSAGHLEARGQTHEPPLPEERSVGALARVAGIGCMQGSIDAGERIREGRAGFRRVSACPPAGAPGRHHADAPPGAVGGAGLGQEGARGARRSGGGPAAAWGRIARRDGVRIPPKKARPLACALVASQRDAEGNLHEGTFWRRVADEGTGTARDVECPPRRAALVPAAACTSGGGTCIPIPSLAEHAAMARTASHRPRFRRCTFTTGPRGPRSGTRQRCARPPGTA